MRHLSILTAVVLVVSGCTTAGPGQPTAAEPRPTLVASLDGDWIMTGDVLGKPVQYRLTARPVLQAAFTELHMTDLQNPPEYEARVFIGYDNKSGQVVVHWMDVFGAMASIPHGIGTVSDDTIEFTIPYQEGPFRDILRYDSTTRQWRLTIEASDGSGGWKHFAAYDIQRSK